jgi:hypothetical protein
VSNALAGTATGAAAAPATNTTVHQPRPLAKPATAAVTTTVKPSDQLKAAGAIAGSNGASGGTGIGWTLAIFFAVVAVSAAVGIGAKARDDPNAAKPTS